MSVDKLSGFYNDLEKHFTAREFLKITLGNYKGQDKSLKKIFIKPIKIKKGIVLNFNYRYKTKDIAKNYTLDEGIALLKENLNFSNFRQANYMSTAHDAQLQFLSETKVVLKTHKPSVTESLDLNHDKNKNRKIKSADKPYLVDLKITNTKGVVLNQSQDKYKQINHYIEILSSLIKGLPKKDAYKAVDMGSGKGYLTFALYDYLTNTLNQKAQIVGVEFRKDMVDLCNSIAKKSNFDELLFAEGTIQDFTIEEMDILIALHACDTATDDAIKKGIDANAELIVVAPCCHKQIRRELENNKPKNDLDFLTQHGIFLERHAEMLTDGLRAQILEYFGYKTRVFEFIALDHTPKNVLIVAQKSPKTEAQKVEILEKIKSRKDYFGVTSHYLEEIMGI